MLATSDMSLSLAFSEGPAVSPVYTRTHFPEVQISSSDTTKESQRSRWRSGEILIGNSHLL